MKRRKVKALVVALVLTCLSGMTAMAASNACNHEQGRDYLGAMQVSSWTNTHIVNGQICTVSHSVTRLTYRCHVCNEQFTLDKHVGSHSNSACTDETDWY